MSCKSKKSVDLHRSKPLISLVHLNRTAMFSGIGAFGRGGGGPQFIQSYEIYALVANLIDRCFCSLVPRRSRLGQSWTLP